MDNETSKKLKRILISFVILIFPVGYLFTIVYAFKIHTETIENLSNSDDQKEINVAIMELDKALRIVPWSSAIRESKYRLHFRTGNYRIVLNYALENDAYEYAAMMYEYLEKPDSAKIYYTKIINEGLYENEIADEKNIMNKYAIQRHIALIYTFLGDTIIAKKYLLELNDTLNFEQKEFILGYDFYIDNYHFGGSKDFFYGETVSMTNDTISKEYNVDSLLMANRITSRGSSGTRQKTEYIFRLIHKEKAENIGFKQIEE